MARSTVCKVMAHSELTNTYGHLMDVLRSIAGHRSHRRRADQRGLIPALAWRISAGGDSAI
jgi:hypothetical protein